MKRKLICGHCAHLREKQDCELVMMPVGYNGEVCTGFVGTCENGCGQCQQLQNIIGDWGTCDIDNKPEHIHGPRCDCFRMRIDEQGNNAQLKTNTL